MVNRKLIYLIAFNLGAALALTYKIDDENTLSQILMLINIIDVDLDFEKLISVFRDMFPFIILQIIMGAWIYRHFTNASAYYFIRQKGRSAWLIEETLKLLRDCATFIILYIIGFVGMICITSSVQFNKEGFICLIYIYSFTLFYTFLMILLCNIVAVKTGSACSFAIVFALQTVCIAINGLPNGIPRLLFYINPFSNYVLKWHSNYDFVNTQIPILWTYIYYIVCIVVVFIFGLIVINKHDIMGEKER